MADHIYKLPPTKPFTIPPGEDVDPMDDAPEEVTHRRLEKGETVYDVVRLYLAASDPRPPASTLQAVSEQVAKYTNAVFARAAERELTLNDVRGEAAGEKPDGLTCGWFRWHLVTRQHEVIGSVYALWNCTVRRGQWDIGLIPGDTFTPRGGGTIEVVLYLGVAYPESVKFECNAMEFGSVK